MAQGAPTSGQEMRAATDEPEQTPDHHATTEVTWFDFLTVFPPYVRNKSQRRRCRRLTFLGCKQLMILKYHIYVAQIPRADPECFLELLFFVIPRIIGRPLARPFRRSSFHSPRHHRNLTRCHAAAPLPEPASDQCPGRLGSFTAVSAGSGSAPPAPCLRHPAAARWYGRYRLLSRSAG